MKNKKLFPIAGLLLACMFAAAVAPISARELAGDSFDAGGDNAAARDTVVIRDAWRQRDAVERRRLELDSMARAIVAEGDSIDYEQRLQRLFPGYQITRRDVRVGSPHTPSPPARHKSPSWSGIGFGFTKFLTRGWKNYEGEMEMDWARSFTIQLNMADYILVKNRARTLLLYSGVGLEYNRLCFDRDITIRRQSDGSLTAVPLTNFGVTDPRRSVFKALYLTMPLLVEKRYAKQRGFVAAGLTGGMRLHSKTKIVYDNPRGHKQKLKQTGPYTMLPFKVDASVRVGWRGVSVWASKSLTPMFNPDKAPRVYPFTIGIGFGS
ncbi:MAG: hypothetical protein LBI96_07060 [Odoribacteraceae bacterium]|jgi:hypothetical protein|nr:hypothetical protein [Odoribacteraceae bacterium]